MNAEILRLLANVLRVGVIEEIDAEKKSVRVRSGELLTDWLRWNVSRAGDFNIWIPPSIGEQVLFGCVGGNPETGFLLGSIYGNDYPAPGQSLQEIVITAPDGARFHYDAETSALTVSGIKTAKIEAAVSVTLDTPHVECTQHLKTRTFELTHGGTMQGDVIHSMGYLLSNGVIVHLHKHPGVMPGPSLTLPPAIG